MADPKPSSPIRFSPLLAESARKEGQEVLETFSTPADGLTSAEAAARREKHGPDEVVMERQHG